MRPVEGILKGDNVLVPDESGASRLHNKGHYGVPQSGGSLLLHLLEAIYLVDKDRLTIHGPSRGKGSSIGPIVPHDDLLSKAVRTVKAFEVRFAVYRDLRERGYIIDSPHLLARSDGSYPDWDLEVYNRGTSPESKRRPQTRIFSTSERAPVVLGDIIHRVENASGKGYRCLLSLVDEEGDLTYYEVRTVQPSGKVPSKMKGHHEGQLLEDRVVISGEDAQRLYDAGYYGKPTAGKLQLSFLEAAYLLAQGVLTIRNAKTGRKVGSRTFHRTARERQHDFNERLKVYSDLRDRGMVVKTGFKYGTHFRVYQGEPKDTHARFLMHAVPETFTTSWQELSRAVRLAHGVRKEILFTRVLKTKGLHYVQFKRVRP
jgi:tRNA-intron endonuclease